MPATDQGVNSERYTLIPRTLIFITREDKILLIKGSPTKRLWANLYNGIGGHVESGEDILTAARRELLEETGLQVGGLRLAAVVTIDTGLTPGIGIFVFCGICPGESGQVIKDDILCEINQHEGYASLIEPHPFVTAEGTLEWVPVARLSELSLVEDLHVLLPRVLERSETSPPLAARYRYDESGRLEIDFAG